MHLTQASPELSITGQITTDDIPMLAEAGFRAIICNRPDDEEPGQPPYEDIVAAATAFGIELRYQPVRNVTPSDGAEFGVLFEALPKPVLAYCRSGARCTNLWMLSGKA